MLYIVDNGQELERDLKECPIPSRLRGFVVAGVGEGGRWGTWDGGMAFERLGDPTASDDPKTYQSYRSARRGLARCLSRHRWTLRLIGVYFWVHPEADWQAIEKYARMTGVRYPGSVTR